MEFAALGEHEVLAVYAGHRGALGLRADVVAVLGVGAPGTSWPRPEPRLSYAADAMLVAGVGSARRDLVDQGLDLLGGFLDQKTPGGHLPVAPVGASGPTTDGPPPTTSPSTSLPSPRPAPGPQLSRPMTDGRPASPARSSGSLGDNDAHAPMRGQPQPGRRGNALADLDVAARPELGGGRAVSGGTPALQMVSRGALGLRHDPRRVTTVLFVPGEEMPGGDSRAVAVTERILAMDDAHVTATLADLTRRFGHRHRDLEATWKNHFSDAARRLGNSDDVPTDRALLIGAYFTREVSPEGAGLFNPSIVAHPDQSGLGT